MSLPCHAPYHISQAFGENPNYAPFRHGPEGHRGLDLVPETSDAVLAPETGLLDVGYDHDGYGHFVTIATDEGRIHLLAHMEHITTPDGEVVAEGEPVGIMGARGLATGKHIHWEVRVDGECVDPLDVLHEQEVLMSTWKGGWHLGNKGPITGADWCILRTVPPAWVTFLTGEQIGKEEVQRLLEISPHCQVVARPYFHPQPYSLTGAQSYMDLVVRHLEPLVEVVPPGQLWVQPYNEPNMPRWANWEGFGDTPADMAHYNDAFLTVLCGVRGRFGRRVQVGWGALTPGNRDSWWPGDPEGVHYYLHGPEPAVSGMPMAYAAAAQTCLCRESIEAADAIFAHIYLHDQSVAYRQPWLGLRYRRCAEVWPHKPIIITECGYPRRDLWPHWGDDALVCWLRTVQADEAVRGLTLWILGDAPDWGRPWSDDTGPRAVVGEIAHLREEVTGQPPPAGEVERQIAQVLQTGIVPLNPWAAFEQAGSALGFLPAGPETDVTVGTAEYRAQAYRDARRRDVQYIVYTRLGEWGNLKWFTWRN